MNLQEFASQCADIIELKFEDVECVDVTKVIKNNGIYKTALIIRKVDGNLSPTIYMDEYYEMYERGASFDEIMPHVIDVYCNSLSASEPDLEFFGNFEEIKNKLMCKVINKDRNEELLRSVPYVECLDLAIVFYIIVEMSHNHQGTVLIKNEHMERWKAKLDDIYEAALKNTKEELGTCIWNIEDVLLDMIDHSVQNEERKEDLKAMIENDMSHIKRSPLYVMSNKSKCLGAACMLDQETLKKFSERINSSFYILPSSIHELILVPDDDTDPLFKEHLLDMVIEVNATQIDADEFLADRVYRFPRELGYITFA